MSIAKKYGAYYFYGKKPEKHTQRPGDLYAFTAYSGNHDISVNVGDSVIFIDDDKNTASWVNGDAVVSSKHMAVLFRGYQCGFKKSSLTQNVNLPYINGCASKQIFHPERIGDPTFQQLTIPPHTSEQKHHIHATVRVVYVLSGHGYSIVGQDKDTEETELNPGMVCVLDPMSPHHFRTENSYLTVLPVHVFSSTPGEQNHPMFNGTKEV